MECGTDLARAFETTNFTELIAAGQRLVSENNAALIANRIQNSVATVSVGGQDLHFLLGAGGMQGGSEAPEQFLEAFRPRVQSWNFRHFSRECIYTSPADGHKVEGSIVGFADDLLKI